MNVMLIAVNSLGVIALVSASILYVASKKFAGYEDCLLYTSMMSVVTTLTNVEMK